MNLMRRHLQREINHMNTLHQIRNEIASMIKGYARTEYEPCIVVVLAGRNEKCSYTFNYCAECEFITVVKTVGENDELTIKPRIKKEHFNKTLKYIIQDANDNEDIVLSSGIFHKWIFKDCSNGDGEDVLQEAMEF